MLKNKKALISKSIVFLTIIFALLFIWGSLSGAFEIIKTVNTQIFVYSALFFLLSVIVWVFSWAYLVNKRHKSSFSKLSLIGFGAFYGSLTPVQLGSEALRSIRSKELIDVPYTVSFAASLIAKGLKFLMLSVVSAFLLFFILSNESISGILFYSLISGFIAVVAFSFIFLLPFNQKAGYFLASLFKKLAERIKFFSKAEQFFIDYSNYLQTLSMSSFIIVVFLGLISWIFEFLSLFLIFNAMALTISFMQIITLFVLIAILERTPFLPKGFGVVETIGFAFLSFSFTSTNLMSVAQISLVLIAFDVVRILIPSIASLIIAVFFLDKNLNKSKKPNPK